MTITTVTAIMNTDPKNKTEHCCNENYFNLCNYFTFLETDKGHLLGGLK